MNNQSINNYLSPENVRNNSTSGNETRDLFSALNQVLELAASETNPQISFNKALERVQVLSGISRLAVLLKPLENNSLRVFASAGYSQNVRNMEIPLSDDNAGWVFSHQQSLRINNRGPSESLNQSAGSSVLIVPISYQGRHFGVVISENINKAITSNEENFFSSLGTYFGGILANTELRNENIKNDILFSFFINLVSKVHTMIDKDEIVSLVSTEVTKLLTANKVQIIIGSSGINQDTNDYENSYRSNKTIQESGGNRFIAPFFLDKATEGCILVERDSPFSIIEQKFLEAVAVEVGSVLDKLIVVKKQQIISTREKQISDVTSKIWASQTIDLILQTAIKEIGSALGADEAVIRLN